MIHVIYGDNRYLGIEKINSLIDEFRKKIQNFERVDFESSDSSFDFNSVLEAVSTVSLFGDTRLVVVRIENDKDLAKVDESVLAQILEGQDIEMILQLPKKYEKKHKLSKLLSKKTIEHVLQKEKDAVSSIEIRLKDALIERGMTMTWEAKRIFLERLGDDYQRVITELDKLSLVYKDIDEDAVNGMVSQDLTKDVFALGNALIAKDRNKAFQVYHALLKQKHEPLSLIPLIAASLRSIYQVEALRSAGLSDKQIPERLKMSTGQYWYITKNQVGRIHNILGALNALAEIDQKVKLGEADPYISFEVFMIRVMS